jgi:flagellar hook assembly protein FlgD
MSLKHGNEDETLKLLIFSFESNRVIPAGKSEIISIPIDGNGSVSIAHIELVDYFGRPIEVTQSKVAVMPKTTTLYQNHPNPFNAVTTIAYELQSEQHVRIDIFNIMGQRVVRLVDERQPAGNYNILWDGTDAGGREVASGIFIYRLVTDDFSADKKMILLK